MKDKVGGGRMGRDTCQTTVQITPGEGRIGYEESQMAEQL